MKALTIGILLLTYSVAASASSNLQTNPYLPYPSGCTLVPKLNEQGQLDAPAISVFDSVLQVPNPDGEGIVPLGLKVYRSPCAEPNRSLIWMLYSMAGQYAESGAEIPLPYVTVQVPGQQLETLLRPTTEPGAWGAGADVDRTETRLSARSSIPAPGNGPASSNETRYWLFLLDNRSPTSAFWGVEHVLTPSEYNARLHLSVQHYWTDVTWNVVPIEVPATSELWPQPPVDLPISGRLSGNWVFEGAADQGVMLAISGRVPAGLPGPVPPEDQAMVVFMAHYTFDAQGNMLWLTGAADIAEGQNRVTIPIENVTNGEFRGEKVADREIVGSVTITSNSCNNLTFEYDYASLGLGHGIKTMHRLFSLETAGYDCRDYEAKVAANQ